MLGVGCSTSKATHKLCRLRKCQSFANKFVNELFSAKPRLDENERKEKLNKSKVFEHDRVQSILPDYVYKTKDVKRLHNILENVKFNYVQVFTNRSCQNMVYHNALLSTIVFNKEGASQTFLSN
jgi:hypothetical protein